MSYAARMRTTVRLNDELLREAKRAAAESGRTLTALIEEALRERLARRARGLTHEWIELPAEPGGPLPGVDIDNSAALLDLMEGPPGPPGR